MTQNQADSSARPEKRKLLLVDDDEAVVSFMAAKLVKHYKVIATTNPSAVVALAAQELPDLILCDINMPGMNGDEVAWLLSENDITHHIPLIYLTSLVSPDENPELDDAFGGHKAVSKSAPLEQLLACIATVLK